MRAMHLKTSFRTTADPDRAFDYLADFGRIAEWDPFVARAVALDPGPARVGSRYDVIGKGGRVRLRYEVTDLDPVARRVRLIGSAAGFRGWDEIRVAPAGSAPGAVVTYEAEIGLHGWTRLFYLLAPLMLVGFAIGGSPMRGMRRRLDAIGARAV
jgi:hypothetical protein